MVEEERAEAGTRVAGHPDPAGSVSEKPEIGSLRKGLGGQCFKR